MINQGDVIKIKNKIEPDIKAVNKAAYKDNSVKQEFLLEGHG